MRSRRPLLVALAALALGGSCGRMDSEPERRPNVLLVVLDTLRRDHLGAYGHERPTSPVLDALAERGVLFEDCLAQSSWTMPSMISMMTAQPLFSNLYRIPEGMPSLGASFREAGYRTAAVVANALLDEQAGFARGYEHFEVRPKRGPVWDAERLVDVGRGFLEERAADGEPFLLWLHFLDTHAPYTPAVKPPKLPPEEVFDAVDLAAIEGVLADLPEAERERLGFQVSGLSREVQFYDAELAQLDARLGELFGALEQLGLAEDTYVAVVADHGEGLFRRPQHPDRLAVLTRWRGDRGEAVRLADILKMEHDGWLFDELVATPWILAGPGLAGPRRVPELVTNMDLAPTLAGLCGLPRLEAAGRDLSRALLGGSPVPAAEFAVSACSGSMAARTASGRKLILPEARLTERFGLQPEVYELREDPEEQAPRELDDAARALAEQLRAAAEADPFRAWYAAPDEATLDGLRELGYVR